MGPDPNGAGVVLVRPVGTRGRGIPFVPDLGVMSTGSVVPSLRAGATVALTHAHPVWKRTTGDEDEDDEDEDGWGLRAVGACAVGTRSHAPSETTATMEAIIELSERGRRRRLAAAARVASRRAVASRARGRVARALLLVMIARLSKRES